MSEYLGRISQYSPKRLALLAEELHSRVQELERVQSEPIAIVGIGCRLPGGVSTPEQYWQLLRAGVDAIREVPPDRWDADAVYDPDPDAPGKMATRWGGFIDGVDAFDPHFFGISPREAQSMDPQQRFLLEVAWKALEHAAISPQRLEETRTSVYVGVSTTDYYQLIRSGGVASLDAYTASGVAHSVASGRLSYVLGLRGPSVTIDTACSSSLVAIHHAVGSLRRGESNMALAGGVNLVLGPDVTIALSKARMMAPDGRCKVFDASADGFVRGEGCGMLVLKRLADAQADGDRILALIRGSAVNQDGRSNGLTAPNGPSQIDVLRDALANANLLPHEIGYVEAHGTGTSLGDPIEVQALGAVFGAGRGKEDPLLIGSVKANIGHLEAAAGAAGLIKLVLALKHGEVPGQIHLRQPNPHIAWDDLAVRVPTTMTAWPATPNGKRIGGVSSFGFSGTNVHMLLEDAPLPAARLADEASSARPAEIMTLSARSDAALATLAGDYAEHMRECADGLADVAHTLNTTRAHFPHRAAVVARSRAEALDALERLAGGETTSAVTGVTPARAPRVAFLFTGQGSQYAGMARGLFESQPRFRAVLEQCENLLRPHLRRSLVSVLFPEPGAQSPIDDTEYTQPALFAVEYALATLWMSWGLRPTMVMGHSIGELVAACVAGVFSLEDALKLVASRGKLMGALPRDGGMVALRATEAEVNEAIAPWRTEVGIAAINGPTNIVISGLQSSLQQITARLAAAGIDCTPLNASHAFHSPLMQPMLAEFRRTLASIAFAPPRIDLVSNVTSRLIGSEMATAEYWADHVLQAVQFAPAIQAVAKAGCDIFLEIGPHPTLLAMARQCLSVDAAAWLPSLRKGKDDWAQVLESLASLYVRGADIDWRAFDAPYRRSRLVLPGYPFQRERYWISVDPSLRGQEAGSAQPMLHPLLGREVVQSVSAARLFESRLDVSRLSYLSDHRIRGQLLLPSSAFMEMSLAAGSQQFGSDRLQLEDFTVHQALSLEGDAPVVQLVLDPSSDGACSIRISSFDSGEKRWIVHATVQLRVARAASAHDNLDAIRARASEVIDCRAYYGWLGSLGLDFGPRFRASQTIARRGGEVLAHMKAAPELTADAGAYIQHPALLDACLHLIGAALPGAGMTLSDPFLLINVERMAVHGRLPHEFWTHIVLSAGGLKDPDQVETFSADLTLLDDAGMLVAEFIGVHLKRARPDAGTAVSTTSTVRSMIHEIAWRDAPPAGSKLPSPGTIASRVAHLVAELAKKNALDAYGAFLPRLDALASAYIVHGLSVLGFRLSPGERFRGEALRERLGVQVRYERLFGRVLSILAEDGVLAAEGGEWRVVRQPVETDADALCEELLGGHPDCAAELKLTRRCAQSLAPVLRGETDPLSLLFPDGSLVDTENLYQNSPPAKTYNGLVAGIIAACSSHASANEPLRILEIGAGTGSTTAHVLRQLQELTPGAVDYTFTDISPLFLKRAAEKFGNPSYMQFRLLDAATDPIGQGFEPGSFDIVISANALHATPDLDVTLANVRGLLRPGGQLVLLEGATPQRFGDLTVGLLDGWWAYSDTQRRNYALMPREQWLKLLGEQGFVDAFALPGEASGAVLSQQAVYLAQVPADAARAPSRFVIVPDRQGFALAAAHAVRAGGDMAEIVPAGPAGTLAANLRAALGTRCDGIVFLPALDVAIVDGMQADAVIADQQTLLTSALAVVQTLASRHAASQRLWFVTRGGQATGAEPANPAQATVWGFSHAVALEHPELSCTRLDLDLDASVQESAAALAAELRHSGREDQIALRGGKRLVRRLVRRKARASAGMPFALPISAGKSYLVTGGFRGLGLRVAGWLADQGATHLVLMGRSGADAHAQQVIEAFEVRGVKVVAARGDVGVRKDLERVIAGIAATGPRLAGVVHTAGVLDDGVISSQKWSRFATVMGPKVTGTWLLHTLAPDLDFLVLFSSGASLAGYAGQSNHAAANAFEDALAWYRQAQGLPTVSINWGPWAEIGAAVDRQVSAAGLAPIAAADGLAALGYAMRGAPGALFPAAQLAVFATDWSHLVGPEAPRLPPLFAELVADVVRSAPQGVATSAGAAAGQWVFDRVQAAPPNRRKGVLRNFVRQHAAKVLGLQRGETFDVNEPLRQLGFDSLMALELRNALGKALNRTLPATVTFDNPSVEALADFLLVEVFADKSDEVGRDVPATPSETFESMTEDELAVRLAVRLERLGNR